MKSFGEIISTLLVRHNCVILPNFGGFVARVSPAHIDETRGIITPPRKAILFNQQLTNSDGLLISEYALANEVTYTEAQATIHGIIDLWNDELKSGKRIGIERVGELHLDIHGRLSFVQDRFFNLLLSSYGLGVAKFIPISEKVLENVEDSSVSKQEKSLIERMEEQVDLTIIQHPATRIKSSKWKYVAAAACFLPIAFYSFWIPTKTNALESGMISINDFNPFNAVKPAIYKQIENNIKGDNLDEEKSLEDQINELPSDTYSYSYEFDETLFIPIKLKPSNSVSIPAAIPVVQPIPVVKNTEKPVVINTANTIQFSGVKSGVKYAVVGCFSEISNAKSYVETLKNEGFNAQFLDVKNGLYRISIDSSTTADSLQPTIQKAQAKGYNTWILK
jgi:nucleoid DNA-binding protein